MYDYLIVTHIPTFYKVNLYNELSKRLNIFVVFIALNTNEKRSDDFVTLKDIKFKYQFLFNGNFQSRNILQNIKKLKNCLKDKNYKKLLVGGWDLKEFWFLIFIHRKSMNCLVLESTINESRVDGIRGFLKRIFLSRISLVFASGKLHDELLQALYYKGDITITKGVGIINKPEFQQIKKEYKKRFLFIGRISQEKNISLLVDIFNELKEYTLTIVGTGPIEKELKNKAKKNIIFAGQVDNILLKEYFLANDIFILPSIAEPWGLVVEEALYFGLPVIVSKNCGVSELVLDGITGNVIDIEERDNIQNCIEAVNNEKFQELLSCVKKFSIEKKDIVQIQSYVNVI